MPKSPANEMRAEYDFSQLKGGVRGKYYSKAKVGTNLVLIDPDLAKVFPDGESVNRALRLLLDTAHDATVAGQRSRQRPKKALQSSSKKPARIAATH